MNIHDVISSSPDILSGTTVFKGTRVPVETLFDHLESGLTIDYFLDSFPSVSREQVHAVIEAASKLFNSKQLIKFYEAAA